MSLRLSNFYSTTLSSSTNGSQTTIAVSSITGFPAIPTPVTDYFYIVVVRASDNAKEVMKVTDYTGSTLTVIRAQEGTTGLAFAAGDAVGLRFTAQTIIDMIAEEAAARIAATILESQFGALTIPASALKDDILALRHIPAGLITGSKLNSAVAGAGLGIDGSGNLKVNTSATVGLSGDDLIVPAASLTESHSSYSKFMAYVGYYTGNTGTGQFYTGTRPWTTYGNAGSGARIVMVQIQNDHATQIAQVGIRIGGTLGYYEGTDSDTGVLIVNAFRIDDTTTRGSFNKSESFTFVVPPGHHWMFENQTSGTGTPNLVYHNYIEFH